MVHPIILHINNSKLFAGCIMILMNIGGRYVSNDITAGAHKVLNTKLVRNFLVFCIAFVATRDVVSSLIIVLLFLIIFRYFLNEDSNFCVLPKKYIINIDKNGDGIITEDEIRQSKELLNRLARINKNTN
jgi:hypothetical protein